MKAVVLEVKGNKAAVLKNDGTIVEISRKCQVGEEIDINETPGILVRYKKYITAAAAFVLVCLLGVGGYVYAAPVAYVTVESDTSFEFAINRFDEVVSMKALDESGKEIQEEYKKKAGFHPSIDKAVGITSELLLESNRINTEQYKNMKINAVSDDDSYSRRLSEKAQEAMNRVESNYEQNHSDYLPQGDSMPQNNDMPRGDGISQNSDFNQRGDMPQDGVPVDNGMPGGSQPDNGVMKFNSNGMSFGGQSQASNEFRGMENINPSDRR